MPKRSRQKYEKNEEWPVVVYMWAIGLGLVGYLIFGEMFLEANPHPLHWLSGLIGVISGIGIGWLWFRWRGDVF